LVLLTSAAIRFGRLDVPLERDEGEYAYAGQLMLQGVAPYERVYNMKYPGIYAAYAAILYMFGETHTGIHLALLIINILTSLFIFLIARRFLGSFPAVASVAIFSFMSLAQSVQGLHANAEHFVILFAVGGLYTLVAALEKERYLLVFIAGILLGISLLMKQHGAVYVVLALCFIPLKTRSAGCEDRHILIKYFTWFLSGFCVVLLFLVAVLVSIGTFNSFWFWTVDYARIYVSGVPIHLALSHLIPKISAIFRSAPLLVALSGLGFICLFSKKVARIDRLFVLLFVLFSVLSVCPGFYFRPHYFILILPSIALLGGVALLGLSQSPSGAKTNPKRRALVIVLFLVCLGHTLFTQRQYLFSMSPMQISRSTYWLNPFPESIEIAKFIREHTTEDEYIAVLGSEPQIYFYTQRQSSSGFIYMYPMMEEHEYALEMQNDFIREIEAHPPSYIVYVNVPTSWSLRRKSHKLLFEWFNKYKADRLELVGIVELLEDGAKYRWKSELARPLNSKHWLAIFRDKSVAKGGT